MVDSDDPSVVWDKKIHLRFEDLETIAASTSQLLILLLQRGKEKLKIIQ
jgi:hypothetical protein